MFWRRAWLGNLFVGGSVYLCRPPGLLDKMHISVSSGWVICNNYIRGNLTLLWLICRLRPGGSS